MTGVPWLLLWGIYLSVSMSKDISQSSRLHIFVLMSHELCMAPNGVKHDAKERLARADSRHKGKAFNDITKERRHGRMHALGVHDVCPVVLVLQRPSIFL